MVYFCVTRIFIVAAWLLAKGVVAEETIKRSNRRAHDEREYDYPGPGFEWQAPRPGDARGPCPVFNTLANHGIVNRSGIDIPVEELFELTYRFTDTIPEFHVARFAGARALGIFHQVDGVEMVTLSNLYSHNTIEHDASLVRSDNGLGFEKSKYVDVDLLWGLLSMNAGSDFVTANGLWRYQSIRINDTIQNNPTGSFTTVGRFGLPAEKLFLLILGQKKNLRKISKYALLSILGFERLPTDYVPYHVRFPRRYDPTRFPESAQWKYTFANGTAEMDLLLRYTAAFDALVPAPSLVPPVLCTTCN